jgi:hypothetical protein
MPTERNATDFGPNPRSNAMTVESTPEMEAWVMSTELRHHFPGIEPTFTTPEGEALLIYVEHRIHHGYPRRQTPAPSPSPVPWTFEPRVPNHQGGIPVAHVVPNERGMVTCNGVIYTEGEPGKCWVAEDHTTITDPEIIAMLEGALFQAILKGNDPAPTQGDQQ